MPVLTLCLAMASVHITFWLGRCISRWIRYSPRNEKQITRLFCCQANISGKSPPQSIRQILERFPADRHAILVSRPLREIYPRLYLHNLKGSSRRITSF